MRIFLIICLFVPVAVSAQQKEYVSPAGTKFLLYTPPAYATSSGDFPVLISLHGKGEWGTDITRLTSKNPTGMPSRLIYLNQWPSSYNFIVVTPQYNPPNVNDPNPIWPPSHIDEVLNYVIANWRVKTYRVYVTGLSLGANATWNYAAAYPHKVAAIVPISGRADLSKACAVKNIPAWVFHGDDDPRITMYTSQDMVNAINNCEPKGSFNRKFNILYTRLHEGWGEIYNGTNGYRIYEWLMKFHKTSSANTTPYVGAGPDLNVKLSTVPVNIVADAFDSRGQIASIAWRQLSGVALTLKNTNQEMLEVSNLKPGTFEFEVSATDDAGAKTSDRMVLRVYDASTLPAVSRLVLVNGQTGADVRTLSQGMTIDRSLTGLNEINIRAESSANTQSIRFTVNTNRNTRTVNAPGPFYIRAQDSSKPEWQIRPGEYVICATPFSAANGTGSRGLTQCVRVRVIEGVPQAGCEGAGSIFREVWPGVPGQYVSNIPLTTEPIVRGELYKFESPTSETGAGDNYGARVRGYVCPPETGKYYFWIASDDRSELWLSTDDNPANKVKIASVSGYTASQEWTKYYSQRSGQITLTAGRRYYIEALHKEATLADHMAVGWQLPSTKLERPIPGIRLIPFLETSGQEASDLETISGSEGIFPNPIMSSETGFNLKGHITTGESSVGIRIFSSTGRIIQTSEVEVNPHQPYVRIVLTRPLASGVYFVHVTNAQGEKIIRLIVH
jgi:hypothetical protein